MKQIGANLTFLVIILSLYYSGLANAHLGMQDARSLSGRFSDSSLQVAENADLVDQVEALTSIVGWDIRTMRHNAMVNAERYCNRHFWDPNWLGPEDAISLEKYVMITGEELTNSVSNIDPVLTKLHALVMYALAKGEVAELERFFLDIVNNSNFTVLTPYQPKTFMGETKQWLRDYQQYAEPAVEAALLLIPSSMAYLILSPQMDEATRERVNAWGRAVFEASNEANDGIDGRLAGDRRANKAAAYVAWGTALGDKEILLRGAELLQRQIIDIRADGSERNYIADGTDAAGRELHYENVIYGFSVVAAHLLERNGIHAYDFKKGSSGSLEDGLIFHLYNTFYPEERSKKIRELQDTEYREKSWNGTNKSLAYLELVAFDDHLSSQPELLAMGLEIGRRKGFYAGWYGYLTCLFSGDKTAQISEDPPLTSGEIQDSLSDRTFSGTVNGALFVIHYEASGNVEIEFLDGGMTDRGTWTAAEDVYCAKWQKLRNGEESCYDVFLTGPGSYFFSGYGRPNLELNLQQ